MPLSCAQNSLLFICVLAAFAFSTVENYKCAHCSTDNCNIGIPQTCEASGGCFNHEQELKKRGQRSAFFQEKGCSVSKCVPLDFTASLGNEMTFGYGTRCCQDELCNREDFQESQKSSEPNGIKCPACYIKDDMSCDPVLLNCTGKETKCVEAFDSASPRVVIIAKGCASESACNLKNISIIGITRIHTSCISIGSAPVMPIISPILISFFLLKVLL